MKLHTKLLTALVAFAASPGYLSLCRADVLYTFDGPQFFLGESTPIPPTSPNTGDPTFLTTFAQADPGGAQILQSFPVPSPLVGRFLTTVRPGVLILGFSQPVFGLDVDFVLDAPFDDGAAHLELVTSSSTEDPSCCEGYYYGHLSFSSATPFISATLDGFDAPGHETPFAIDNLSLSTAIPEPSLVVLAGAGLAGLIGLRRRVS